MRLFHRTQAPSLSTDDAPRDPAYYEARQAYQDDKKAAMAKQIELLARLNRLGYELDITTGRERNVNR